jgi:hypothetical protein
MFSNYEISEFDYIYYIKVFNHLTPLERSEVFTVFTPAACSRSELPYLQKPIHASKRQLGPKKMLWFPLHVPEKVGTEGMNFYLLNIFIIFLFVYLTIFLRRRRRKFLTTFFDPFSPLHPTSSSQTPLR